MLAFPCPSSSYPVIAFFSCIGELSGPLSATSFPVRKFTALKRKAPLLENENGLRGKQEKIELGVRFLTPASGAAAAAAGAALLRSGGRC